MTVTTVAMPQAPAITVPGGRLLDVATVRDGIGWIDGTDLFESYNCLKFDSEAEFCNPNDKDLDQVAGWISGFRFAAYGGVTCKSVGMDMADQKAQVERAFNAGESTAVERAFLKTRFIEDADVGHTDPWWDAPVDITPAGGAVKPVVGVAMLEGFARDNYVGVPTLHVPVEIGSLLLAPLPLQPVGSELRTHLGSKVAVGGGYDYPNTGPDGTAATAGEKWIYATGEVLVLRGETQVLQSVERSNNDVVVLAERPYVGAVDCFAAAIRVQETA